MSKPRFLAFDTETGGFDPNKNPILTAYFAVVGEDYGILDELYLFIKPESPFEIVEPKSLEVNKIVMSQHLERADLVSRAQAKEALVSFLKKNKPKGTKLRPLGHNVEFDIQMLKAQIFKPEEWEDLIHYSKMDTKMSIDLLKDAGWLPGEIGTLESVVKHFSITQLGAHDAKNDTLMMIEAYKKIVDLLASKKSSSSDLSFDVLSLLEK